MTWNSVWPDGTVSVKANEATGVQNTSYVKSTMGSSAVGTNTVTTRDHFWDVDADLDGRHRFIQSRGFTVGGDPADPVLGTLIDTVSYSKLKSTTESTVQQDVQPFFKNAEVPDQIMQMLGIRAMGVFTSTGSANPTQAQVVYSHNLALQAAGTPGIVRTGTGRYTITFATALPSNSYLVLGCGIRNDSSADNDLLMYVPATTTLTNSKSTASVKIAFRTMTGSGSHHTPLQGWFVCFGG